MTERAFSMLPECKLCDELRQYADIAEAGDKAHWAAAMRRAADLLQEPAKAAMRNNGASYEDLHVCGQCDGTGFVC
jgi:hypothetical protein